MSKEEKKVNRRDFLFTASYTVGAVGVGAVIWPMIDQMNPDKAQQALATTEVDISNIEPGKSSNFTALASAISSEVLLFKNTGFPLHKTVIDLPGSILLISTSVVAKACWALSGFIWSIIGQITAPTPTAPTAVSYTHLRAHETR